ncbi:hypothetical protein RIF29_06108 [Crotalaria pallida]|uniref:Uncharacterized protein n=1 Tax=Crotalaria pallida TaxID=3830 RepID=A0AAN9J5F6_CROPI
MLSRQSHRNWFLTCKGCSLEMCLPSQQQWILQARHFFGPTLGCVLCASLTTCLDNMQKLEVLKALSDMWKDFDSRALRYKVLPPLC